MDRNQIFRQSGVESLVVDRLQDGSTAIVDSRSKSVHSLNASATLVWDACAQPSTAEEILKRIESTTGQSFESHVVEQGLAELLRSNLIETDAPIPVETIDLARRSMLKRATAAGAIAIPVVLSLTASEQKAYAYQALSGTTTTIQPAA